MTINDLPSHKGELSLTHNGHKSNYETIEEFTCGDGYPGARAWVSDEQRDKAIAEDSIWVLHWYPDTPNGFIVRAACDLDVLLAASKDLK